MKHFYLLSFIALGLAGCGKGGSKPANNNGNNNINNTPTDSYVVSTIAPYLFVFNSNASGSFGMTTDPSGNVYISNLISISKITPQGMTTTFASGFGTITGMVSDAAGNIFVIDEVSKSIKKVTPSGVISIFASGVLSIQTSAWRGIAIDISGNLYIADLSQIKKITPAGIVSIYTIDTSGVAISRLAIDASGILYASYFTSIRKMIPGGTLTNFVGGNSGFANGTGANIKFNLITGMAIDKSGNIYVSENANSDIRKITPAGVATTLAGTTGVLGTTDGPALTAVFQAPIDITIDNAENICIFDGNIRKISKQ